jgi:hypothetical protein
VSRLQLFLYQCLQHCCNGSIGGYAGGLKNNQSSLDAQCKHDAHTGLISAQMCDFQVMEVCAKFIYPSYSSAMRQKLLFRPRETHTNIKSSSKVQYGLGVHVDIVVARQRFHIAAFVRTRNSSFTGPLTKTCHWDIEDNESESLLPVEDTVVMQHSRACEPEKITSVQQRISGSFSAANARAVEQSCLI